MAKENILVVDDEEDILELVRFNLDKEGFKVVCSATGEDALKRAHRESFDLFILDLMLPGIEFQYCNQSACLLNWVDFSTIAVVWPPCFQQIPVQTFG